MMNIRVDEQHAYVELEIFGQYQVERFPDVIAAMRDLVSRHGHFSELEIHHGKPGNMLKAMSTFASAQSGQDFEFMTKMRKYALVSDNPGLFLRLAVGLGGRGKSKMRIFKAHERDLARQWIEAGDERVDAYSANRSA